MKVTLILVASVDGRTTLGDKPGTSPWASPEDQAVFKEQLAAHDCIVMGSATYETARAFIVPDPHRPRIVMTRTPHQFNHEAQPGLSFSASGPGAIVAQANAAGYSSVLLVGGARTNARFLDAGLVDEILVTIEPLLFGSGLPMTTALHHTIQLKLINHKLLNSQGTLLARYAVQHI